MLSAVLLGIYGHSFCLFQDRSLYNHRLHLLKMFTFYILKTRIRTLNSKCCDSSNVNHVFSHRGLEQNVESRDFSCKIGIGKFILSQKLFLMVSPINIYNFYTVVQLKFNFLYSQGTAESLGYYRNGSLITHSIRSTSWASVAQLFYALNPMNYMAVN